jgi:hypothetical protein
VEGVAASHGTVWAIFGKTGELAGFDRAGDQTVRPVKIQGGADGVVAGAKHLWVINSRGVTPISAR